MNRKEYEPWTAARLRRLRLDVQQAADLAFVPEDIKRDLLEAADNLETIAWRKEAAKSAKERADDQRRTRTHNARRQGVRI